MHYIPSIRSDTIAQGTAYFIQIISVLDQMELIAIYAALTIQHCPPMPQIIIIIFQLDILIFLAIDCFSHQVMHNPGFPLSQQKLQYFLGKKPLIIIQHTQYIPDIFIPRV